MYLDQQHRLDAPPLTDPENGSIARLSRHQHQFNDHPDASRIYWLAKRRKGKSQKAPVKPKSGYLNGYGQAGSYGYRPTIPMSTKARASISTTRNIARKVRRSIRRGWPTGAVEVLSSKANKRYLTKQEEAQLRGEVAHAYFIFGYDDKAIRQARYAIGVGRESATMAYSSSALARAASSRAARSGTRCPRRSPSSSASSCSGGAGWASTAAVPLVSAARGGS